MDVKKIIYVVANRLEGFSLALPAFVVGLGFMILGVTLLPGVGILVGIFIWWIAWRFMATSSQKSRVKEALKRIKEKQAALLSSSISKSRAPDSKPDVKNENRTESEKQETTTANSDHSQSG